MSTARRASGTVIIPLMPTGSFVVFVNHSTSAHVSRAWYSGFGPRGLGAISIALRVEKDEAAHGGDGDRPGERHAEEARPKVDRAHVHEDVLLDGEAVEVAAVTAQRPFRLGAAVAEVPRLPGQPLLGGAADLGQSDEARARELGHDVSAPGTAGGASRRTPS